MTEVIISNGGLSAKLDEDLIKAKESLRTIEDGIRSLSGRPEFNNNRFSRSSGQFRNFSSVDTPPANIGIKRRIGSFDETNNFYQPPYKRAVVGNGNNNSGGGYNYDRNSDLPLNENFNSFEDEKFDFRPSMASSVNVTIKEVKSREMAIAELKETEKTDNKTRNKRMFGLLLGTLQKFKKEEDGKHYKEQEKRQKEIDQKLEDAKRKEQMDLKREREKLIEKRRKQQQELRRLQRKKAVMAATENQISLLKRFQNFIQTQSKPQIFFLPAKHTIRTIELQKKSEKRLDESIKRKQEELEKELKFIDDFKNESGAEDDQEALDDENGTFSNSALKSEIRIKKRNADEMMVKEEDANGDKTTVEDSQKKDFFTEAHDELLNEAAKIADVVHLIHDEDEEDRREESSLKDHKIEPETTDVEEVPSKEEN